MEEDKVKTESLIVDSNIILACIAKSTGLMRASFILLAYHSRTKFLCPSLMVREVRLHAPEIARRYGMNRGLLDVSLAEIFSHINVINEESFKDQIGEARRLVSDEKDIPIAALALRERPCTILTKNSKDFKTEELRKMGVRVLTPATALKDLFGIDIIKGESRAGIHGGNIVMKAALWFRKLVRPGRS